MIPLAFLTLLADARLCGLRGMRYVPSGTICDSAQNFEWAGLGARCRL